MYESGLNYSSITHLLDLDVEEQRERKHVTGNSMSKSVAGLLGVPEDSQAIEGLNQLNYEMESTFKSAFKPTEMRQLALVAHNHMKPAMKSFIETHGEILKKFRITGTNTTISMCKAVFGEDDPDVVYGATCRPGHFGGDVQIAALMMLEDVGGIIFFVDPMSAHPHQVSYLILHRLIAQTKF